MSRHNPSCGADLAPLFDWRPTISGNRKPMAESPNTDWSEVHRRVFMAVIAFIGVFIMFAAQYIQTNFWHDLTEHFGTAIFISAGLGLTIEWWLTKQITENVFAAAMGYELPDDLREEASKYTGFRYATQNP